jgi:hypothetical protein
VCLRIPSSVARQRLGRNVTAVTNTHATGEELLDASFSMRPVSHQGKCITHIVARQRLIKNPHIVVKQRLGKIPHGIARQRLCRNVTAVTNKHATIEELLDASFSMWTCMHRTW